VFEKDPNAVLDYKINWNDFLTVDNATDTIVTSTWTVPSGITKDNDTNTTTTTTIWLKDGTAGTDYTLTNRIVTTDGRTQDQSIIIQCKGR
jgi:hypothetical protein